MSLTTQQAAKQLKKSGIVAILRGDFAPDDFMVIAETLAEGGISVIEVTLNSSDALGAIERLRTRFGDTLTIGAGTVRVVAQVEQALNAGAQFLVSPNFDPLSVVRSRAADVLHLPGVATPSEVQAAFAAGCKVVKLFPADILGGPAYIKALRAPLNDVDFAPTGGIDANNMAEYRRAGAVACGAGSSLIPKNWTRETLTANAKAMRTAWDNAL